MAAKKTSQTHPGFNAVAAKIAKKQGVSMEAARAIVAKSSRNASPAAKRANPRLNRVRGSASSKTNKKGK